MKLLKQSGRQQPKVSLILLDWSVRESFHLLHYLGRQDVPRDAFEVIVIEYYSRVSDPIRKFEDQVDTWMVLEMPEDCYYHKHLMYNAGIALARGEICVICDSDAMVKPGFIRAISEAFDRDPNLVLHLDQFRNNRRDLYPFSYPSFEDVEGEGCINNLGGKTTGILEVEDPIHARNYGACMCARREDMIAIGGADEHVDYVGHICGPYDMTFRLFNRGRRELWHQSEFMYHTWHPGQAGADNYLGPHDGRHVSTTAIEALTARRVMPLVENPVIRKLRTGAVTRYDPARDELVSPGSLALWRHENLDKPSSAGAPGVDTRTYYYKGFRITNDGGQFRARLLIESHSENLIGGLRFEAADLEGVRKKIDRAMPTMLGAMLWGCRAYLFGRMGLGYLLWRIPRRVLGIGVVAQAADGRAQGGPGIAPRVTNFVARLRTRIGQFTREVGWLADSLADIVPNLFYLERARPDCDRGAVPVLLVDSYRFRPYIRFLMSLRAIPSVQLEWVCTSNQLQEFLKRYEEERAKYFPIIARSIYVKYYPLFAATDHVKNVTIL